MARYCFYCGRELTTGEKCGCRTADQQEQTDQAQGTTQTKAAPGKGTVRKRSLLQRIIQFFNPFDGRAQHSRPRPAVRPSGQRQRYRSFRLDGSASRLMWRQIVGLMTRPVDALRQTDLSGNSVLPMVLLLLTGLFGGLFLVLGISQPQLQLILSLNSATATAGSAAGSSWFLFVQGFGISLVSALLLVLTYHIALRALFHRPFSLISLLTGLSPALFYIALFLLASLLVLPGSVISALLTLMAGFAVSAIAQYLLIRRLTNFDENRCFILVAFVLLVDTGLMALLFNLALPIINALMDHSVVI